MATDYPLAQATVVVDSTPIQAVVAPPTAPPARGLNKDRSSRFHLPNQKSHKLIQSEIDALKQQGFPTGFAQAMTQNNTAFPLRIWVVDNSGSMNKNDGQRIASKNQTHLKMVPCTRWTELQQTVEYHIQMASLLKAPTIFRLLNDPGRNVGEQQFGVAQTKDLDHDVACAQQIMLNASPGGVTPLANHVREIRENVAELLPSLQRDGSRVAIILATDGLPTNPRGICDEYTKRDFVESLRELENLPVWVVVRLCTDDDDVVEFYNNLDTQLELSLEVLDDFQQEAKEVYSCNKWLNYALPLHRCREMGYYHRLLDLLDERKLTIDEVKDFLRLMLGDSIASHDPQADWDGFIKCVKGLLEQESTKQWNPMTKKAAPWIDLKKLEKEYKPKKRWW